MAQRQEAQESFYEIVIEVPFSPCMYMMRVGLPLDSCKVIHDVHEGSMQVGGVCRCRGGPFG